MVFQRNFQNKNNEEDSIIESFKKYHKKPLSSWIEEYVQGINELGEGSLDDQILWHFGNVTFEKKSLEGLIQSYLSILKKNKNVSPKILFILALAGNANICINRPKVYKYLNQAADVGLAIAFTALGNSYFNARDNTKDDYRAMMECYQTAAAGGSSEAVLSLAQIYEKGMGVKSDNDKALEYYYLAAKQNHPIALFYLAKFFKRSDPNKTHEYFAQAAKRGCPDALAYLGQMYFEGKVVEKNITKAVLYFELSAEQGSHYAYYGLAKLYESGNGIEKNIHQAAWYYLKVKDSYPKTAKNQLFPLFVRNKTDYVICYAAMSCMDKLDAKEINELLQAFYNLQFKYFKFFIQLAQKNTNTNYFTFSSRLKKQLAIMFSVSFHCLNRKALPSELIENIFFELIGSSKTNLISNRQLLEEGGTERYANGLLLAIKKRLLEFPSNPTKILKVNEKLIIVDVKKQLATIKNADAGNIAYSSALFWVRKDLGIPEKDYSQKWKTEKQNIPCRLYLKSNLILLSHDLLATISENNLIVIINYTKKIIHELLYPKNKCYSLLKISNQSFALLHQHGISIWNLNNNQSEVMLKHQNVISMTMMQDGKLLSASQDLLIIWSLEHKKSEKEIKLPNATHPLETVIFAKNQKIITLHSVNNSKKNSLRKEHAIKIWSEQGAHLMTIKNEYPISLCLLPGNRLAGVDCNGIYTFDLETYQRTHVVQQNIADISRTMLFVGGEDFAKIFYVQDEVVATYVSGFSILLWNIKSGRLVNNINVDSLQSCCTLLDGHIAAVTATTLYTFQFKELINNLAQDRERYNYASDEHTIFKPY